MNALTGSSTTAVVLAGVLAASIGAAASQSGAPGGSAPAAAQQSSTPGAAQQSSPAAAAQQSSSSAAAPQGSSAPAPADDKNAATYTRVCSTCHDAQRILSNRRTKDQWGEVIDKMVERGAQGTDEDFAAVQDYLVSHFGRVNVNRATAKDLATVLKIPDKDAEAIVAFRTQNGPFTDFDSLAKVPGLDLETLKQNRDAVSF
jgi:competence protein ComEA